MILSNYWIQEPGRQKSGKFADVVYGWSLSLRRLFSCSVWQWHYFIKKIHEYSWMVSTPGPMTSKAQHAQNFFLFFQKKKRVIFAWKTSNITNTNDTESRKFHACTNCILQFWTKKESTMVPKPPEKVQWKNECTCPILHSKLATRLILPN